MTITVVPLLLISNTLDDVADLALVQLLDVLDHLGADHVL